MGVTAVVQHHVADYEVWRKAYDAFLAGAELRAAMQQAGVQGQPRVEIYQDA